MGTSIFQIYYFKCILILIISRILQEVWITTIVIFFKTLKTFFFLDSYILGQPLGGNFHSIEVNNSYRCNSEENIQLDFDGIDVGAVKFSHVQMEAFRTQMNANFNSG